MYFDSTETTPRIGPSSGNTQIKFKLPDSFPLFNPDTYFNFQQGFITDPPLDNVVVR